MDGKKSTGSSPSITEQLFGPKESTDTAEVLKVIFSPKSKALAKEAAKAEMADKNKSSVTESSKTTIEEEVNNIENEKHIWGEETLYNEQRTRQPCGLSSSIYYGGQDFYHPPKGTPSFTVKNDATENEQEGATRGDWWQGSLYY